MKIEEKYMRRCLQLARNGLGRTAPNPMVGAVIVCGGRIIGEGYHVRCGGPHAEVNAIASVREPELLPQSTMYVSLEPCSHYGKTPPCADLIIEKRIPRVVVGCADPFAQVAGRGIEKLRQAGVEVVVGVCEAECRELNKRFITFHGKKRPYVTLKWAESADRFIDRLRTPGDGASPVVFSTPATRQLVHKRRAEHQAILVGSRTARLDNPSLTVRDWDGPAPLRLVIDRSGMLPATLRLFDGPVPTRVYTAQPARVAYAAHSGVTCVALQEGEEIIPQIFADLHAQGIQSLLVEGGAQLHQAFIDASMWDEIIVERSPLHLGEGVPVPVLPTDVTCSEETFDGVAFWHFTRPL